MEQDRTHRTVEGRITGLNANGDGLMHEAGLAMAVARTAPGDRVRVRLPAGASGFVQGDLVQVLKPGPERVEAPCPFFRQGCGACQWLHLDYQAQLEQKTLQVRQLLADSLPAGLAVRPTLGMDQPRDFRNKLSLQNQGGSLRFMQEFNHQSLAPEACLVQTRALDLLWGKLRSLRFPREVLQVHVRSADAGKTGICLFVQPSANGLDRLASQLMKLNSSVTGVVAVCNNESRLLAGKDWLEHRTAGLRYRIPLSGFFQTNYSQARVLLREALALLGAGPDDRVLDLYCGGGFFSLPLAQAAREVLGLENNAASVQAAGVNAGLNGLANARFMACDVGQGIEDLAGQDWPLVLLDPPRQGCEERVLRGLVRLAPRRLVYVSCLPESLARDLRFLVARNYRVTACQPVDLFPHSHHVETLVCLERQPD